MVVVLLILLFATTSTATGDGDGGEGGITADEVEGLDGDVAYLGAGGDDDGAVEGADEGDTITCILDGDVVLGCDVDGEAIRFDVGTGMDAEGLIRFVVEGSVRHGF